MDVPSSGWNGWHWLSFDLIPLTLINYKQESINVQYVDQLLLERDSILEELKYNLCRALNQKKVQPDYKKREVEVRVGEIVYLQAQPYRMKSLASRSNEKLSQRFYGPYAWEKGCWERSGLIEWAQECGLVCNMNDWRKNNRIDRWPSWIGQRRCGSHNGKKTREIGVI